MQQVLDAYRLTGCKQVVILEPESHGVPTVAGTYSSEDLALDAKFACRTCQAEAANREAADRPDWLPPSDRAPRSWAAEDAAREMPDLPLDSRDATPRYRDRVRVRSGR